MWSREICVPANRDIPYRYLICTVDPINENVHVRRWETHMVPRKISADQGDQQSTSSKTKEIKDIDTFGDIAGVEKIDRGWLTTETVYQFKFIKNPFKLKQKLKKYSSLYVKVTIPILLQFFFRFHFES